MSSQLTAEEAAILDHLVQGGPLPADGSVPHTAWLVDRAYLRVVGGVLVVSTEGIKALNQYRRIQSSN